MASKVYWKELTAKEMELKKYIQKWDIQLTGVLTTPQMACVKAVLTAIDTCLAALPKNTPVD